MICVDLWWLFHDKWDHLYSLRVCKGSNIQGSGQPADGGPDIQGSVQFGHELMFPLWKIETKKKFVRNVYLALISVSLMQIGMADMFQRWRPPNL